MTTPLTDSEIAHALEGLNRWERVGDTIETALEAASFADAVALVVRIGFLAEAANHHPDLDVRWRTVKVSLTTHDVGGLSDLDLALAGQIDEMRPQ